MLQLLNMPLIKNIFDCILIETLLPPFQMLATAGNNMTTLKTQWLLENYRFGW